MIEFSSIATFLFLCLVISIGIIGVYITTKPNMIFEFIGNKIRNKIKSLENDRRNDEIRFEKSFNEEWNKQTTGEEIKCDVIKYEKKRKLLAKLRNERLVQLRKKHDKIKKKYLFWRKPLIACPTCMASIWGGGSWLIIGVCANLSWHHYACLIPAVFVIAFMNNTLYNFHEKIDE